MTINFNPCFLKNNSSNTLPIEQERSIHDIAKMKSRARLDQLPQELLQKIADFAIPSHAYLNHRNPDKAGILYTSKQFRVATFESQLLKTKPEAVNEIIRQEKGSI